METNNRLTLLYSNLVWRNIPSARKEITCTINLFLFHPNKTAVWYAQLNSHYHQQIANDGGVQIQLGLAWIKFVYPN